jgi:NTE family protein
MQASKKLSLTQKIQAFLKNRITLAQAMFRPGILEKEDFQGMIDFFLPDMQIQDLRICFRAMATDLITGEPVVISEGPLRKAVLASCAVPGAVPPIQINDALLSDGGIINMVPAGVARDEGAGFVVAVSVNTEIFSEEKLSSAWDIYARSSNITGFHLEKCLLQDADVVIRPNVGKLHWTDFTLAADLILEGERATINKLPDLINVLPRWRRIMKKRKGL